MAQRLFQLGRQRSAASAGAVSPLRPRRAWPARLGFGLAFTIACGPAVAAAAVEAGGAPIHVMPGGSGDGASWSAPTGDLVAALAAAGAAGREVWIGGGVFRPGPVGARESAFEIPPGVTVRGGFAGFERHPDERIPGRTPTVLSGDLAEDDPFGSLDDNAFQVVRVVGDAGGAGGAVELDQLTVEGGSAGTDMPWAAEPGGGVHVVGGRVTLRDCHVGRNAGRAGGAVHVDGGRVVLLGGIVLANSATEYGGGLFVTGAADVRVVGTVFDRNAAGDGGAIAMEADGGRLELVNVLVAACVALGDGGGLHLNGGTVHATFTTVAQNTAIGRGGGIHLGPSHGALDLRASVLAGNQIFGDGRGRGPSDGVPPADGPLGLPSSTIREIDAAPVAGPAVVMLTRSVILGWPVAGAAGAGVRAVDVRGDDPRLVTELAGRYSLRFGSPAIDLATMSDVPADTFDLDADGDTAEPLPLDLAGDSRVAASDSAAVRTIAVRRTPRPDAGAFERRGWSGGRLGR